MSISFIDVATAGKPTEEGRYLIKYFDKENNYLPDYMIAWFKNGEFYQAENCNENATLEGFFGCKVFEYAFLPNLMTKSGKYC